MDRYYYQTIGVPVFTLTGLAVSRIVEVVIEPENGKIAGFLLSPGGQYALTPNDVVFWDERIFIHDEDDVAETKEIIKLIEVLKKNIPILHNKVYTKKGVYLGKVYDIGINPKLFTMTKIVVAKSIWGLFPHDERIIMHDSILEITSERIIVKDSEETAKVTKRKENLKIDIAPSTMGRE